MAARSKSFISWWQIALIAILIALFVLFAMGLGRDSKILPSPLIGKPAYNFDLKKLGSDERLRLSQLKGRGVVLNFWASWCVTCLDEHHVLVNVGRQFKGSDKISFIGVNHKDTQQNAAAFMQRNGVFPYPSVVDRQGRLGLEYGVYGMPETFFINKEGIVVAKHIGAINKKTLLEKIKLIGGRDE